MIFQRVFMVSMVCGLVSAASFGCQMVCGDPLLILCDVEVDRFDVLLNWKTQTSRGDSNLAERLTCHIDDRDGRIISCPTGDAPEKQTHQFKTTIRKVSELKLDALTGERREKLEEYLDIEIRSPKVPGLPEGVGSRKDDVLRFTYPLKDCPAQTKQQRLDKGNR